HTRCLSDWSSDVCSSDLGTLGYLGLADSPPAVGRSLALDPLDRFAFVGWGGNVGGLDSCVLSPVDGTAIQACASLQFGLNIFPEIGRASCRERGEVAEGG